MKRKSIITFTAALILISGLIFVSQADSTIVIRHNNTVLPFQVMPINTENHTMIPVRTAFEMAQLTVGWNLETLTVSGSKNDFVITLKPDSAVVNRNGREIVLSAPVKQSSNTIYVPLDFISVVLGLEVVQDTGKGTVDIYSNKLNDPVTIKDPSLNSLIHQLVNKPIGTSLISSDVLYITALDASNQRIGSLDGLEHFSNLKTLNLKGNNIGRLNSLMNLADLAHLDLSDNEIVSITPLNGLRKLEELDLRNNKIADIRSIPALYGLKTLYLSGNRVNTEEQKSPLYYLKGYLVTDLNLDNIDEPKQNTWNLRADASLIG